MPAMGPSENPEQVDLAYKMIMRYLASKYQIQKGEPFHWKEKYNKMREERNATFKEALRLLFELDAWEGF